MSDGLIAGSVLAAVGLVLVLAGGRGQHRVMKAGTVAGPVDLGSPRDPKPVRGWVEWVGLALTLAGFVMGIVGLFRA